MITRSLRQASVTVQTAQDTYGQRLALAFASPSLPKTEQRDAQEFLLKWKHAVESVSSDCKAFYWLHDCKWIDDKGFHYPGESIFIKQVAAP